MKAGWTEDRKMGRCDSVFRDLKDPLLYRGVLGEFLGVMFLVFVGCASPYGASELDHTRVSLSFGLSVATMVWILASVSGGHINPAVSVGMLVTRKITIWRFILYLIAQIVGSIIGALILKGVMCDWQVSYVSQTNYTCGLGLTSLGNEVNPLQGCAIELLITFVLVITVFATCDKSRNDLNGSGPLAIGLSVTMCHLGFIRMTGSSMNPARSFGPAVVLADFTNHWVYWVGPMLGGMLAAIIYEFLFAGDAKITKIVSCVKDADYRHPYIAQEDAASNSSKVGAAEVSPE